MPPQTVGSPYIDMWMDYEPDRLVQKKHATTRKLVPDESLTGCTFRISATEQGSPIGTLTDIAATHAAGGHYVGAIDMATLQAQLPALTYPHGTNVYLQFFKSGDIQVDSVRKQIRRTRY
jgi:hypothetical protein